MEKDTKNSSVLNRWKSRQQKEMKPSSLNKAPEDAVIPLSNAQQRLWFLQQLYPGNPVYNYSESYIFDGVLDTKRLLMALEMVCNGHDVLRSTYHIDNGRLFMKTVSKAKIAITEYDFSQLPEQEAQQRAKKIMDSASKISFDLAKHPLIYASLMKMSASKHLLMLTMHHISTDKWSMDILRAEMAEYYIKLVSDIPFEPSINDIQYSDFAYWQQRQDIDRKQLAYWKNRLSGELPLVNLPTDRARPKKTTFKGKSCTPLYFSESISRKILALATKMETTPYVLFLAVYYVLLYRYTGQKDILIGSPVSSRDKKILEGIIGFFNDTLILRSTLSPSFKFSDFVDKVKRTVLEAFANKSVPFDVLVRELKLERSLGINPFFQVMFLYHSVSRTPSFGPDLHLSHAFYDAGVSKFDLTLDITEENGILSSTFEYASDLFDQSTVLRLQEHLQNLIEGVLMDPHQPIAEIAMLTGSQKQFFLDRPTPISNAFSSYKAIHHIIEEVGRKHPEKIALTFKNSSITYEILNRTSAQLAVGILEKTQKHNETVGLCIDRSIEMIVGLLAILKAGCAYLPIDPKYPSDRLDYILEDAQCDVIVAHSSLEKLFENSQKELVLVDQMLQQNISKNVELPEVEAEDLAYVIYTSGSTGKPKGVPISHKNIISSTAGRLAFYPNNPDSFLLMSSISFDSSKAGIFWTLCTGGNLIITESRVEQDIHKIERLVESHKVSHTLMLPSLYKLILEYCRPLKLQSLKTVIVAGEACMASVRERHFEKMSNVSLYNEYGPTEATVWCTAYRIEPTDKQGTIPVGRGTAGAKIYLLNENLNLVPFGAVGEIYVGGPGLAKAYINNSELSQKVFIENPFDKGNEKIYKTGDLGRYRTDGALEFLGRADQQVKIRGFRVELEEIEKIILQTKTVTGVVALVENRENQAEVLPLDDLSDTIQITAYLKNNLSDEELNRILGDFEFLEGVQKSIKKRTGQSVK